ncbi:MAG: DUF6064 family protein, partial [Gammaproteobacteria bacterium]
MHLPFTSAAFLGVFRQYNETVWPAQVFLLGLALVTVVLVLKPTRRSGVGVSLILGLFWAWLGVAYHLMFFARINPFAYVFSAASVAGAVTFIWQGVVRRRLHFAWQGNARGLTGSALLVFALIVYPVWSRIAGHPFPSTPTFGLPCPTTLFTVGVLAFLVAPYPRSVYVVPIIWCAVGAQAAFLLGVHQDLALLAAGAAALVLAARSKGAPAPLDPHR